MYRRHPFVLRCADKLPDRTIIQTEITMRRALVVGCLLFALCSITMFSQAASKSPMFGTWKLNVAKSKYSPGPAPKSQVAKLDPVDGGMKVVSDRVEADG